MKKVLLLSFILLSLSTSAQLFSNFGFKLGYTSANMSFDAKQFDTDGNYPKHSSKGGFNFSFFGESHLTSNLYLVSNLEYSQKGFITNDDLRDSVRFHILSLEALCKYKVNVGVVRPFITIGPRIDFLLSVESDPNYNPAALYIISWAIPDTYKNFSFGGTVSVGSEFVITDNKTLFFEVSYKPDFTDLLARDNFIFSNVKNNAIDISIGMIF